MGRRSQYAHLKHAAFGSARYRLLEFYFVSRVLYNLWDSPFGLSHTLFHVTEKLENSLRLVAILDVVVWIGD